MKQFVPITLIIGVIIMGGIYIVSSKMKNEQTTGKPVIQSHRSYEIEVVSGVTDVKPQQPTQIIYKIKNDKGEILKNFAVAHEKIMHFITVRKDLAYFQHLHPDFNQTTGEFSVAATFPEDGSYRIFPDFTPGEDNPQKLPVTVFSDIEVGNLSAYSLISISTDTENKKSVNGYEITYLFPQPDQLKAQEELTYSLLVEKDGGPVNDLENYLGAKGHSVIIKEKTLDYIHTHALDDNKGLEPAVHGEEHVMQQEKASELGNQIDFATMFPESGTYKIFTQFQHQGKVVTTDYVLKVNE